jgi:hypothetical protein
MLVALSLALLFKEDVGISACFLGAYVMVFQRRVHLGAIVILLGAVWLVVGINLIVPYYWGNHAHNTMSRYGALGGDWEQLLLSPLRRPATVVGIVFSPAAARYVLMVLAPFAFLPLLSPKELLLAIPPLAENILSAQVEMRSTQYHYEALLLPVLYLAFVLAVARLSALELREPRRGDTGRRRRAASLQIVLPAALVLASPLLHHMVGRGWFLDVAGDPARAEIEAIVARVPAAVPVISLQHIQPHVSDRTVSAYLHNVDELAAPFAYAVVPAAMPAPAEYEIALQGRSYSLLRRRDMGNAVSTKAATH